MAEVEATTKTSWFDQTIKASQVLVSLVGLVMLIGGGYMSAMVQLNLQHNEIEHLKTQQKEQMELLKEINAAVQDIRLDLKDKENRK